MNLIPLQLLKFNKNKYLMNLIHVQSLKLKLKQTSHEFSLFTIIEASKTF
jgi:hypothetical protein